VSEWASATPLPVEVRPEPAQGRRSTAALAASYAVVAVLLPLLGLLGPLSWTATPALLGGAVGVVVEQGLVGHRYYLRRSTVTVSPWRVHMARQGLRAHVDIAWRDVADVRRVRRLGVERLELVMVPDAEPARVRLVAPYRSRLVPDARFEDKERLISRAWHDARG